MTRNVFMKGCAAGMCSCAGMAWLAPQAAQAAESASPELDALKWKMDFAQRRWAGLVQILETNLDEATRKKVWQSVGREHAREYRSLTDKYKGNIEGFLDDIRKQWVESAEYDAAKGTIRIVDRSPVCTCPLVRQNLTPQSFCDCTLGWQKEAYSAVLGRPVEASLEESILRGGKRCVFRIQIT